MDHDQHLNLSEMRLTLEQNHDVNLNDEDIKQMYSILDIDKNNDGKLSRNEMNLFSPDLLEAYIEDKLLVDEPWKHSRLSKQAWLFYPVDYNEIITKVHHRLYDLFALYSIPQFIANDSYTLQVVHYGANGKYNAHYDSTSKEDGKNIRCCFVQTQKEKNRHEPCKSCRYITVLYYLNTVENGGQTVFPLSNQYYHKKRFNDAELIDDPIELDAEMEKYEPLKWRMSESNLPENYCNDQTDNLKVKAEKGKALIWFNHLLDDETGWIGDVDIYSMHTGCPVIKGEKWIANHWILVDDNPS